MSLAACSPSTVPGSRDAEPSHQVTPEKKPMRRISGVRGGGELVSVVGGVL